MKPFSPMLLGKFYVHIHGPSFHGELLIITSPWPLSMAGLHMMTSDGMQRASSETIVMDAERSFETAFSWPQKSALSAELWRPASMVSRWFCGAGTRWLLFALCRDFTR